MIQEVYLNYEYNIFFRSILTSFGRIFSVAHESEGVSVGLASVIFYEKLKTPRYCDAECGGRWLLFRS